MRGGVQRLTVNPLTVTTVNPLTVTNTRRTKDIDSCRLAVSHGLQRHIRILIRFSTVPVLRVIALYPESDDILSRTREIRILWPLSMRQYTFERANALVYRVGFRPHQLDFLLDATFET